MKGSADDERREGIGREAELREKRRGPGIRPDGCWLVPAHDQAPGAMESVEREREREKRERHTERRRTKSARGEK